MGDELIVGIAQRQRSVRQIDTGIGDGKAHLIDALLHRKLHSINCAQLRCRTRRSENDRVFARGVRRERIDRPLDGLLLAAVHGGGIGKLIAIIVGEDFREIKIPCAVHRGDLARLRFHAVNKLRRMSLRCFCGFRRFGRCL